MTMMAIGVFVLITLEVVVDIIYFDISTANGAFANVAISFEVIAP